MSAANRVSILLQALVSLKYIFFLFFLKKSIWYHKTEPPLEGALATTLEFGGAEKRREHKPPWISKRVDGSEKED